MKRLTILVADDEESIRLLIEQWLRSVHHMVVGAGSATQAIAACKQWRFDLVITDILMPDGDGLDLIAAVSREQPAARILAISGGGRYVEGDNCLKMARGLGAHAVLMKPFDFARLTTGIAAAFASQPEPGAL